MWTWDAGKNRQNIGKHGLDFELAKNVFDDPLAATRFDMTADGEERWHTIGMVGPAVVLVVHTASGNSTAGRIISARAATRHERRAYEEGEF